jgi:hypothetical protein
MRRILAILVVWAGLVGTGTTAFACVSAAAAGDCCPAGAPSGCAQLYEQLEAAPAQMVAAEPARELQVAQRDHGPTDPVFVTVATPCVPDPGSTADLTVCALSARTDASLTYLHTGRLRL